MANPESKPNLGRLIQNLDRRWIFVLIGLGTILPIVFPIGFPVSVTAPVQSIYDRIDRMTPEDVVLLSFDYGPTTKPENGPMAMAIFRHCFSRGVKVVVLALYPIGGGAMATDALNAAAAEFPDLHYGVDYVNLGYKDGAQALMKQMGVEIAGVFPGDYRGTPLSELPLMQKVRNYSNVDLVVSLATNVIGEWWVNLVNAQYGTPVAVGCTAVSAPKFYAYLNSGQMIGLLGGLKGASEYERLVVNHYPNTRAVYDDATQFSAMKGMDVQTIDHSVIILFILLGNVIYFTTRSRSKAV
jgi:hypothetical protein